MEQKITNEQLEQIKNINTYAKEEVADIRKPDAQFITIKNAEGVQQAVELVTLKKLISICDKIIDSNNFIECSEHFEFDVAVRNLCHDLGIAFAYPKENKKKLNINMQEVQIEHIK